MLVQQHGQLQLGADPIGAGDQHRLFHPREVGGEHAAKAAQSPQHAGDIGRLHHGLDALYGFIARGDVHTGSGVGLRMGVFHTKTSESD